MTLSRRRLNHREEFEPRYLPVSNFIRLLSIFSVSDVLYPFLSDLIELCLRNIGNMIANVASRHSLLPKSVNFIFILQLRSILSRITSNQNLYCLFWLNLARMIEIVALKAHIDSDSWVRLIWLPIVSPKSCRLMIVLIIIGSGLKLSSQPTSLVLSAVETSSINLLVRIF
jgi:hypothetical protein